MPLDRLSYLARDMQAADPLPPGEEGNVISGADTPTTGVVIEVASQPGVSHGPFPWVSNGLMPQPGDGCMVLGGIGEKWVTVWATGSPVGS